MNIDIYRPTPPYTGGKAMKIDVTTREGYDIATALRGPDFCTPFSRWLKTLFTARIRAWVGIAGSPSNSVCEVRTRAEFAYTTGQEAFAGQTEQTYTAVQHYLQHARLGCEMIASLGGPYAQEAGAMGVVASRLKGLIAHYLRKTAPGRYGPVQRWEAPLHFWQNVKAAIVTMNDLAGQQGAE